MKTRTLWLEQANKKHQNKYTYSFDGHPEGFVVFNLPVTLNCPIHGKTSSIGLFVQRSSGCKHCLKNTLAHDTDSFVLRAKEKHNDLYDYSMVNYAGTFLPVTIICKEHGAFEQTPNNHLNGHGCQKCGIHIMLRTKQFIRQLNEKFPDNFSLVTDYAGRGMPITVVCYEHGLFTKIAQDLLKNGCDICEREKRTKSEQPRLC